MWEKPIRDVVFKGSKLDVMLMNKLQKITELRLKIKDIEFEVEALRYAVELNKLHKKEKLN